MPTSVQVSPAPPSDAPTGLFTCQLAYDAKSLDEHERTAEFVASTATVDAHGEVLEQGSWLLETFQRNPVVLFAHRSAELPIGRCLTVAVKDNRLECKIEFATAAMNPVAEQVWQLVKAGFLRAVSVGFIPATRRVETRGGRTVLVMSDNTLVEISVTPVGANPDALVKALSQAPKETAMQSILKRLGLPASATEVDVEARLAAIEEDASEAVATKLVLGKAITAAGCGGADELVAKIVGLLETEKKHAQLVLEVEAARAAADAQEIERLCSEALRVGKMTPASKPGLLAALGDRPTVAQVAKLVESLPKAMNREHAKTGAPEHAGMKWRGKGYHELTFEEKHELATEDYDLFRAMKAAAGSDPTESDGDEPPES